MASNRPTNSFSFGHVADIANKHTRDCTGRVRLPSHATHYTPPPCTPSCVLGRGGGVEAIDSIQTYTTPVYPFYTYFTVQEFRKSWVLFENRPALYFCNYKFITHHKMYNF